VLDPSTVDQCQMPARFVSFLLALLSCRNRATERCHSFIRSSTSSSLTARKVSSTGPNHIGGQRRSRHYLRGSNHFISQDTVRRVATCQRNCSNHARQHASSQFLLLGNTPVADPKQSTVLPSPKESCTNSQDRMIGLILNSSSARKTIPCILDHALRS
jgi:hypothetical protein